MSVGLELLNEVGRGVFDLWEAGSGKKFGGDGWFAVADKTRRLLFSVEKAGIVSPDADNSDTVRGFWDGATLRHWKESSEWAKGLRKNAEAWASVATQKFKTAMREWVCHDPERDFISVTCPECGEEFFVNEDGKRVDPEHEHALERPGAGLFREFVGVCVGGRRIVLDATLVAFALSSAATLGGFEGGMADVRGQELFFLEGEGWRFGVMPKPIYSSGDENDVRMWVAAEEREEARTAARQQDGDGRGAK